VIKVVLAKNDNGPADIILDLVLENSGRFTLELTLDEAQELAAKLIMANNAIRKNPD
jgi:hypothetical protein